MRQVRAASGEVKSHAPVVVAATENYAVCHAGVHAHLANDKGALSERVQAIPRSSGP